MRLRIIVAIFVLLAILHHDFWNWSSKALVFGFIPVGLFYHALYSIVAASFWYGVIRWAWPTAVERWAEEPGEPGS